MHILGIFTVVSKKGDRFSLGPRNVKILVLGKRGNNSLSVICTGYTCGLCMESHGHLSIPENVKNVSNRCHNFDFLVNY